jgi:hypothetical protein
MKKYFLLAALLAVGLPALAQGSRFDSVAFTTASNTPFGAVTPMFAVPNAKVTICSSPAIGNPCTNSITIYSNPSLTVAAANPIAADGQGRYGFFVVAGNYSFSVCTSTCRTGMLTVGGGAPGASGITDLTGDVLASGTGSTTSALATVNTTPGTCGDATHTSQITVDGKGRTISCTPIAIAGGNISSVFGRTGVVVAVAADYTFSQIGGTIASSQLPATIAANTTGNAATATLATNATTAANATAVGGVTITGTPSAGQVPTATSPTAAQWQTPATGGTVTAVSVASANGISGSSSGGATPALTIVLGAITPTSVTSSGPISSTGSTQGLNLLGVGTGTITTTGFPTNYVGWIAPATGTPAYFVVMPNVAPTAGQTLSVAAPTSVNGVLQAVSTWVTPASSSIANIVIALPTIAIAANTCTTGATATMTGLATTSAFLTAFATDPSAVVGWGSSGGLQFVPWPTANTLNWKVCNATAASITPGALSLNVGAR